MDGMTKEKWQAFSTKEKREYIWDYYKVPMIVGVVVLVLLGMIVGELVTYREPHFEVIMVNSYANSTGQEGFHAFLQEQGLEIFENCVGLRNNYHINLDDQLEMYESMQQLESLYAITAAGKQDLLFDTNVFITQCANAGTLLDLSTVLTAQELERYADHLVYTTEEDTCPAYPCAVKLEGNRWVQENKYYGKSGGMAILEATDDRELSGAFLRYLLAHFD